MAVACLTQAAATRPPRPARPTPTGWVKAKRLARSGVMPTLVATRSNLRDIRPAHDLAVFDELERLVGGFRAHRELAAFLDVGQRSALGK
ncbi:hypothetical protein G6F40_017502 [Rhizopus arrhizus]|nr:hypothetical protein G6F40_017502 [Rhizopus arrhizus]